MILLANHSKHFIVFLLRKPVDLEHSAPCFQNDTLFRCGMMVFLLWFRHSLVDPAGIIEAKKEDSGV